MPCRVTFIIRDLGHGGAQRQLTALATGLAAAGGFTVSIVHFYPGVHEAALRSAGVTLVCVGKKHRWDLPGFFLRLWRAVCDLRPHVVHGYLNEGNLMALILKPLCGGPQVVWGLRDSQTDAHQWGILGKLSFWLTAKLSKFADLIIANSAAGRSYYSAQGYPEDKIVVVPNGIDAATFTPLGRTPEVEALRQSWGLSPSDVAFGIVGRINPMKDHGTFLRAAAIVKQRLPQSKFIVIGQGQVGYEARMKEVAAELGLTNEVIWSPALQDMPVTYASLDCVVSSSAFGEGFSNVIGEAMSCGVPCVVTDVGDSAALVGDPHRTCLAGDAAGLAEKMLQVATASEEARAQMGQASRERILNNFTGERMVEKTADLLRQVCRRAQPRRITFITTGLGAGGAEMMLYQLASSFDPQKFIPSVISLTSGGKYEELLRGQGIAVESLDLPPGKVTLQGIARLFKAVRRLRPDVLMGWMYHGCLATLPALLFRLRPTPIIWNIRQSLYSLELEKGGSAKVIKLLGPLSTVVRVITYNSTLSATQHEAIGYPPTKRRLVANGFDCKRLQPRAPQSPRTRSFDCPAGARVVGRFGRYAPMKDHGTFLAAAALIVRELPETRFMLAGSDVTEANVELVEQIERLGLSNRVHLLGERSDVAQLTSALDVAVSSSAFGEGFPNVVGEAMACGVPVVATDIGDTAVVMGDTGRIVPAQSPEHLAAACLELLRMPDETLRALGLEGRQRIEQHYSLESAVQQFEALLLEHS